MQLKRGGSVLSVLGVGPRNSPVHHGTRTPCGHTDIKSSYVVDMFRTTFQFKSLSPVWIHPWKLSGISLWGYTRGKTCSTDSWELLSFTRTGICDYWLYFQERSISPSPCPDTWLLYDGRSLRSRIPSNPERSRGLTHLRWICQNRISPIPHDSSTEPLMGITKIDTIFPFQEKTKRKNTMWNRKWKSFVSESAI